MTTRYYAAFRIPGHRDLHMTICYMHTLSPEEAAAAAEDLRALETRVAPLTIQFGTTTKFGENNTIPVQLATIVNDEKAALLRTFYTKWYRPQPGTTVRPEQTFHVAYRTDAPPFARDQAVSLTESYLKQLN